MGASQSDGDKQPTPPDRSTVVLLLATFADTTWRMFIPILGLMSLGLWGDKQLDTTPWLMIVGMAVGIALAAVLVRRQMKRVSKS